jgi:polysaccharide biosynthesis transport protein
MTGRAETARSSGASGASWSAADDRPAQTMDIGDFYRVVASRLKLLAPCMAIALGAAAAYIVLTPTTYTATMSILVDPRERVPVGVEAPPMPQNPDPALVESQMRLLTSRPVLRKVAEKQGLGEATGGGLFSELKAALSGADSGSSREARLEAAVDGLEKAIVVKRSERTYVVDVEVKRPTREKAVRMAQDLADAFFAAQTRLSDDIIDKQNAWLDAKVKDLRARVEEAERRAQDYRDQHSLVVTDGRTSPEQRLKDANTALVAAQGKRAEVEARYEQLKAAAGAGVSAESVNEALRSPVIEKLRADYAALAREEAYGQSVLGPRHPSYLTTRLQLESVRNQIQAEQQRIVLATEREVKAARAAEQTAVKLVGSLETSTNKVGDSRVELNELDRAAANLRASYEKAANARENVRKDAVSTPLAILIEPPVAAVNPTSPKILPALLIGLGAGLNLWIVSAMVAEYRQRSATSTPIPKGASRSSTPDPVRGPARPGEPAAVSERQRLSAVRRPSTRASPPRRRSGLRGANGALRTWSVSAGAQIDILDGVLDSLGDVGHAPFIGIVDDASGAASGLTLALARAACGRGERVLLIDRNENDPALSRSTEDFNTVILGRSRQRARILRRDAESGGEILLVPVLGEASGGGPRLHDTFDLALVDCGGMREAARFASRTRALDGVLVVERRGADLRSVETAVARAGLRSLCMGVAFAPASRRRAL